jgi:hypothetical protein
LKTQEEMLAIMKGASNKTNGDTPIIENGDTIRIESSSDEIGEETTSSIVKVPKRENPSKVLDPFDPGIESLLSSLIIQARRTNSLLEQIRNISLGNPLVEENNGSES